MRGAIASAICLIPGNTALGLGRSHGDMSPTLALLPSEPVFSSFLRARWRSNYPSDSDHIHAIASDNIWLVVQSGNCSRILSTWVRRKRERSQGDLVQLWAHLLHRVLIACVSEASRCLRADSSKVITLLYYSKIEYKIFYGFETRNPYASNHWTLWWFPLPQLTRLVYVHEAKRSYFMSTRWSSE